MNCDGIRSACGKGRFGSARSGYTSRAESVPCYADAVSWFKAWRSAVWTIASVSLARRD